MHIHAIAGSDSTSILHEIEGSSGKTVGNVELPEGPTVASVKSA